MTITSRTATVARRVIDVAIVSLVGLALVGLLLGRLLPLLGHDSLIIGGHSMEPAIPIRSAIVLERVPVDALAVGDVVTLRVGAKPSIYTHRIVRLLALDGVPYVETQGDANRSPDAATTPASSVVGRVAWYLPSAGYLLALLSVPVGLVFFLGLGTVLILLAMLLEELEDARAPRSDAGWAPRLRARTGLASPDGGLYVGPPLEGRVARHLAARRTLGPRPRPAGRQG